MQKECLPYPDYNFVFIDKRYCIYKNNILYIKKGVDPKDVLLFPEKIGIDKNVNYFNPLIVNKKDMEYLRNLIK